MANTANYNFKKPLGSEFFNIVDQNDNWDANDALLKGFENKINEIDDTTMGNFTTERLSKDANDIFTEIRYKRQDGTLFKKSVLSGGTSPKYTTRTVTFYASNGTTVTETKVFALTYTGEDLTSEVIS